MAASERKRTGSGSIKDFPPITLVEGKLTEIQAQQLSDAVRALIASVNGHLSLGDGSQSSWSGNLDGQTKEHTFPAANTAYEVPHGLGRVPIGVVQLDVNQNGAVVRGENRGSWGLDSLFLSCSVAGTTALFIVV